MTDETGTTRPDPDDDAVRRLLADARHTEPMPADVAARMQGVLADLAEGTIPVDTDDPTPASAPAQSPPTIHPVVASLAAQRRRRAAGMLVAAAAIVVGGVVVAQHLPAPTDSSSSASAGDRVGSSLGNESASGSSTPTRPKASSGKVPALLPQVKGGRVVVRPQHFTGDALAVRRLLAQPGSASYRMLDLPTTACVIPRTQGRRVNATYEHAPAVLVFHRPESSSQVVDLFVCGSGRPVRSATLPLP